MTHSITIVDYGIGNLKSVFRAFEAVGASVIVTRDRNKIRSAERLVLPGVGAFANCMEQLEKYDLIEGLLEYFCLERPFLGICVGMQMMMATGEEFGTHKGLGVISGSVKAIPLKTAQGKPHKIPHIGWNQLFHSGHGDRKDSILFDVDKGEFVYFVHSFAVVPDSKDFILATTNYNGISIVAATKHGHLFGCQFHPEKSGVTGLKIINRFANL